MRRESAPRTRDHTAAKCTDRVMPRALRNSTQKTGAAMKPMIARNRASDVHVRMSRSSLASGIWNVATAALYEGGVGSDQLGPTRRRRGGTHPITSVAVPRRIFHSQMRASMKVSHASWRLSDSGDEGVTVECWAVGEGVRVEGGLCLESSATFGRGSATSEGRWSRELAVKVLSSIGDSASRAPVSSKIIVTVVALVSSCGAVEGVCKLLSYVAA